MHSDRKKPLHILFITNNYIPYSGGVVSSILTTRTALEKAGHQVTIATLDFTNEPPKSEPGVIRLYCPIRFTHKKNIMAIPWLPRQQINKIIEQIKPDIIHSHHPFLLGTAALHAAQKYSIPCVFTHHTMYQDMAHYVPAIPIAITKTVALTLVQSYCKRVDVIIAPSTCIQTTLQTQDIQTPIAVIPSGIDTHFITAKPPTRTYTQGKIFKLLYVGRFCDGKKVDLLLTMFKQLIVHSPNYQLTLIGYGHAYESLQQYAYQTLNFTAEQVQFIHKPEKSIIAEWYRTADLFVFASPSDTQGLVLAEAMAGGLPVVTLDGPGQRSIMQNNENGFLANSLEEMIEKIIAIAHDENMHQKLSDGAWVTAKKYEPLRIAQQLINVYRGLKK